MNYGQAKFKVKDHVAIHGLPYTETDKRGTKTLRIEDNINVFMDSIENLVYDSDTVWFNEGIYQGGTDREVETIHAYDSI